MPAFLDANGREWTVKFDGLLLGGLRDEHGINLGDVGGGDYIRLERDASVLTTALVALCREQWKGAGLTREQFAGGLYGEALEAAHETIWGAAKVFFPPRQLSALQSNCENLKDQWEAMGPAMAILSQPGIPPAITEAVTAALMGGMGGDSTASTTNSSAPGQVNAQSPPVSSVPDSAASTRAA
jgi:hypothetical protein